MSKTEIKLTEAKTLVLETIVESEDHSRTIKVILKASCQDRMLRWTWELPPGHTHEDAREMVQSDWAHTPEAYLATLIDSQEEAERILMPILYSDTEALIPLVMAKVRKR